MEVKLKFGRDLAITLAITEGARTRTERIDRFTMMIKASRSRIWMHSEELLKVQKCEDYFLGNDVEVMPGLQKAKACFLGARKQYFGQNTMYKCPACISGRCLIESFSDYH